MVIGDSDKLAFEFVPLGNGHGELYLLARGQRIGLDGWDYNLESLKRAFLYEFEDPYRRYYPSLINYSAQEMAQLLYCVIDEYRDERCEAFRSLMVGSNDMDNIFFYSIPYLFDGWGGGLVQGDFEERFFVFDEDKGLYIDVLMERGKLYSLVSSVVDLF